MQNEPSKANSSNDSGNEWELTSSISTNTTFVTKIISGGQTGADQAALVVAVKMKIETGGHAPKGFKTETGDYPKLSLFKLVEDSSRAYEPRTEKNVKNSDATLIFSTDANSTGTKMTIRLCQDHNKPCAVFNPFKEENVNKAASWLAIHQPKILNVAGNRESVSPGIYEQVKKILPNVLNGTIQ